MNDERQTMNDTPLSFLLGEWNLEYIIPKSFMSEAKSDSGTGIFKKILDDQYIQFDYSTQSGSKAKGIFAWDEKLNMYRYWWFENSGAFLSATCNFISNDVLAMNWHDSLLVQTFTRENKDRVILKMQHPDDKGGYTLLMEVIFTRK